MAEFKGSKNKTTVWLKHKTKKIAKGDRKGEEYEVFEGTLDTGSNKMITFRVYPDNFQVETSKGIMVPVEAYKWKANAQKSSSRKAW